MGLLFEPLFFCVELTFFCNKMLKSASAGIFLFLVFFFFLFCIVSKDEVPGVESPDPGLPGFSFFLFFLALDVRRQVASQ
jgi:hypothetical protein